MAKSSSLGNLSVLQHFLCRFFLLADGLGNSSFSLNLLTGLCADEEALFHLAVHAVALDILLNLVEFCNKEALFQVIGQLVN